MDRDPSLCFVHSYDRLFPQLAGVTLLKICEKYAFTKSYAATAFECQYDHTNQIVVRKWVCGGWRIEVKQLELEDKVGAVSLIINYGHGEDNSCCTQDWEWHRTFNFLFGENVERGQLQCI